MSDNILPFRQTEYTLRRKIHRECTAAEEEMLRKAWDLYFTAMTEKELQGMEEGWYER